MSGEMTQEPVRKLFMVIKNDLINLQSRSMIKILHSMRMRDKFCEIQKKKEQKMKGLTILEFQTPFSLISEERI